VDIVMGQMRALTPSEALSIQSHHNASTEILLAIVGESVVFRSEIELPGLRD